MTMRSRITVRLPPALFRELSALAGVLHPDGSIGDLIRQAIDVAKPLLLLAAAAAASSSGLQARLTLELPDGRRIEQPLDRVHPELVKRLLVARGRALVKHDRSRR
jgi:hypothetical protein